MTTIMTTMIKNIFISAPLSILFIILAKLFSYTNIFDMGEYFPLQEIFAHFAIAISFFFSDILCIYFAIIEVNKSTSFVHITFSFKIFLKALLFHFLLFIFTLISIFIPSSLLIGFMMDEQNNIAIIMSLVILLGILGVFSQVFANIIIIADKKNTLESIKQSFLTFLRNFAKFELILLLAFMFIILIFLKFDLNMFALEVVYSDNALNIKFLLDSLFTIFLTFIFNSFFKIMCFNIYINHLKR